MIHQQWQCSATEWFDKYVNNALKNYSISNRTKSNLLMNKDPNERKFKQLITLCHGRSSITMATESSNKCYLTKCIKKIHYICKKASSYSFRTFRRMSTSFSTEASSKSCRRKLLRRSTIPHSGQFADPRINTTSTQFSHLFNQHKGNLHTALN